VGRLLARHVLRLEWHAPHRRAGESAGHVERFDVQRLERRIALAAVDPRGWHGVDHVLCRQPEATRRLGIARRAAAELGACLFHLRPGADKDLTRDAGALVEVRVVAVDECVHLQFGDVALP